MSDYTVDVRAKVTPEQQLQDAVAGAGVMQRIADWLRERRIRRLCDVCKAHMAEGRTDDGRIAYMQMAREITQRSPAQVARMEQRLGLTR